MHCSHKVTTCSYYIHFKHTPGARGNIAQTIKLGGKKVPFIYMSENIFLKTVMTSQHYNEILSESAP